MRYSLTFRSVSPEFRKSLTVWGYSNTNYYKFGSGKGTFGVWTPEKQVYCPKVSDIDPYNGNTASYSYLLIQVGVNDLKSEHWHREISDVSHAIVGKIKQVLGLNPKIKILVALALPTRNSDLNRRCFLHE